MEQFEEIAPGLAPTPPWARPDCPRRRLHRNFGLGLSLIVLAALCGSPETLGVQALPLGHWVTTTGYILFVAVSVGLLVVRVRGAWWLGGRRHAWRLIDAGLMCFLMAQGLKAITGLPRPSGGPTGFPSGHTLFAFTLALFVLEAYPALTLPWLLAAACVGWSRVEVGAHYAYQVWAGCALGIGIALLALRLSHGFLLPRVTRWSRRWAVV